MSLLLCNSVEVTQEEKDSLLDDSVQCVTFSRVFCFVLFLFSHFFFSFPTLV